jgi:RNAse (barnase) inhibitor barstar
VHRGQGRGPPGPGLPRGKSAKCAILKPDISQFDNTATVSVDGVNSSFCDSRRNVTMLLQTVRPNIVQAIRAYRVEDLMQAAEGAGQHFLYANLINAQSKQEVLDSIVEAFLFPAHFGRNLDSLYDCMTDLVHKSGSQPGFVVVLEQLPDNPRFDREAREQLLDVFRDAADFWAERKTPVRCFYSFQ